MGALLAVWHTCWRPCVQENIPEWGVDDMILGGVHVDKQENLACGGPECIVFYHHIKLESSSIFSKCVRVLTGYFCFMGLKSLYSIEPTLARFS